MLFNKTHAGIALAACVLLFGIPLVIGAQSQTPPTTNTSELTDAEKADLRALGVNSDILGGKELLARVYGGCDFNPYTRLERYRSGPNVNLTPRAGTGAGTDFRNGINPELACRLVKFFEYAEAQGCRNIKITSAYRSAQQQEDMCGAGRSGCAPAGRSCHQYGLAVDITSSCTPWMRGFLGQRSPSSPGARQFMLHFPYSGDHIQCSENAVASCSTGTQQCGGKFRISGDQNYMPSRSVSDALRNYLSPQPQQPQQQLQPQAIRPSQPLSQSQTPLNAFQEPQTNTNANTNQNSVSSQISPTNQTGSSSADILAELAFGEQKPSAAAKPATTVPITISGNDASILTGIRNPQQDTVASTTYFSPNSIAQETFVSQDLSWQSNASDRASQLTLLERLRSVLETLASYLKPFGRPVVESGYGDIRIE